MTGQPTLKPLILLWIFSMKFRICFLHLKDLGECRLNKSSFLDYFEHRILGGKNVSLEEYPFSVQFFNFGGLCGGSILTRKIVLTAAHCFDHNTNIAEMNILANSLRMYDRKSNRHEVWDYAIHEFYNNPHRFSNDVAVIIIHDVFEFSPTVQKAFLVITSRWMSEEETEFKAMGWGVTEKSRVLMKTRLRYIAAKKCSKMNGLPITKDMFCLFGDQKADTCQGDSGGGVMWNKALVGIVSHGDSCLQSPGVYANVYHLRFWIKKTVNQMYSKYCKFHNLGKKHKK